MTIREDDAKIVTAKRDYDGLEADSRYMVLSEKPWGYLVRLGRKVTSWYPKEFFYG